MMDYNPNNRPTASECLQHEYFKIKIPIPINASVAEFNEEEHEEFKQTFTHTRTKDNFGSQMKSEISKKSESEPVMKISSLSMMKRARYQPNVNTRQFYKRR